MTTTTPDAPRAVVDRPDSVTHFVCATAVIEIGDPDVTHEIRRRKADNAEACRWCGKTAAALREELGL